MNQNIKNIIFDLGGVLIDWNPRYVFKDYFVTEDAMEYFLRHVCTHEWNEMQDAGRTFEDATQVLIEKFPEYTYEIKQYYGRWIDMLAGDIPETVEILYKLLAKNQYRILALTNWSDESFPIALDQFEFLHRFEGILVSGTEKLKKPEPEIFNLMAERYDLLPTETIFIDDNLNNIATAQKLGFDAIHFSNTQKLLADLQTRGIF